MKITKRQYITNIVIDSLTICLKTVAAEGDDRAAIKLSKYLLRLAEKRGDECIEVGSKEHENDP